MPLQHSIEHWTCTQAPSLGAFEHHKVDLAGTLFVPWLTCSYVLTVEQEQAQAPL
jgi:hypothetical protein